MTHRLVLASAALIGLSACGLDSAVAPTTALPGGSERVPEGALAEETNLPSPTEEEAADAPPAQDPGAALPPPARDVAPAPEPLSPPDLSDVSSDRAASMPGSPWRSAGPDEARCATPLAAGRTDVIYVCDCDVGSDGDCVAGDDQNVGTSAAPLRSFESAVHVLQTTGGVVALCRGGAWSAAPTLVDQHCPAQEGCALTHYVAPWASGNETRPSVVSDSSDAALAFGSGVAGGRSTSGYTVQNLEFTGRDLLGTGILVQGTVADVQLSCLSVSNFHVGVEVSHTAMNVRLEESSIHDNGGPGYLGACSGCAVSRSAFVDNGAQTVAAGGTGRNVHVRAGDGYVGGFTVEDSYFSRTAVDARTARCAGVALSVHGGGMSDVHLFGNIVEEPAQGAGAGCQGIVVDVEMPNARYYENVRVESNTVRNVGQLGIGFTRCAHCSAENNVIVQEHMAGFDGIAMPSSRAPHDDASGESFSARHNTIYFGTDAHGVAIRLGGGGEDHQLTNNVVSFAGRSGYCFELDQPAASYGEVRANTCHEGNFVAGTSVIDPDVHYEEPGFVDAPEDLRLSAEAPGVDSGFATGLAMDHLGRLRDGAPDRGAYEYVPLF